MMHSPKIGVKPVTGLYPGEHEEISIRCLRDAVAEEMFDGIGKGEIGSIRGTVATVVSLTSPTFGPIRAALRLRLQYENRNDEGRSH